MTLIFIKNASDFHAAIIFRIYHVNMKTKKTNYCHLYWEAEGLSCAEEMDIHRGVFRMKIKQFFSKPYRWGVLFGGVLAIFFTYALLDTFVIPKALVSAEQSESYARDNQTATSDPAYGQSEAGQTNSGISQQSDDSAAEPSDQNTESAQSEQAEAVITDTSYSDENISITIETVREYDTTFYVADIEVSDASYLKTAFAQNTYGRNIKETTTDMAAENNAIFAINGDYYGFRDKGYVLRNGVLYRDVSNNAEALMIDSEGNFSIVQEGEISAQSLLDSGAMQILSFGPVLMENGEVMVTADSEVSQSMRSNPRTAIGQISERHYMIIVSDGRTSESAGLSLLELAEQFEKRGCSTAYNLDGGGSSVMYFNGNIINNPSNGRGNREREVSDIVYFGYS